MRQILRSSVRDKRCAEWLRTLERAVSRGMGCFLTVTCLLVSAGAQQIPNLSPDQIQDFIKNATPQQLQELQQRGFNVTGAANQTSAQPQQPTVLTPADARNAGAGPARSILEGVFSDRAGHPLQQFGYDQVGVGASVSVPQTGAVQDDYVLGVGDEVDVILRGQENSEFSATVDRNGRIVLPRTGPVLAAGKTLAEFRQDLLAALSHAYVSTQAYVSVGQLRQVTVLVAGEVANPGMRILTGLSNPLDAILLSGGVKKSGSLRNVKLIRHGKTINVDLYGVLARHGNARLENLQDGDRVYVPPIGATVAVSGYVRRPAIYELAPGRQAMSASELLSLANGPVLRGSYTTSILRIMPDGRGQFVDISGQASAAVRDSEILVLKAAVDIAVDRVTLAGAVRTPGSFAVSKYKTLHDMLPSMDALQPGAYVLFGFIDRIDPATLQHVALPFSPLHVIEGRENIPLISYDAVYVLTIDSMQTLLQAALVQKSNPLSLNSDTGQSQGQTGSTTGITGVATPSAPAGSRAAPGTATPSFGGPGTAAGAFTTSGQSVTTAAPAGGLAPSVGSQVATGDAVATGGGIGDAIAAAGSVFGNKLTDYRVSYDGAVQRPGSYLVAPNTTVSELVNVLGGLSQDVDLSRFEVTSTLIDNATGVSTTNRQYYPATPAQLSHLILQPNDWLVFRHVYSDRLEGAVSLEGEVRYPGTYNILRGEHLSSLLKRAGGLTKVAYPYGTVFLRASVAAQEADQNKRAAADIRSQLFDILMRPTGTNTPAPSADTVVALQALLTQIESQPALGRISIVADPSELAAHPDEDPVVKPGDRIVIPDTPTSVSVLGEVMRPGAFPARRSLSAHDYVEKAGGFTQFADTSRVIIVLPDGSARVDERSWLNLNGDSDLPAGTVIVVARDVTGITFHQLVMDTTQIISQFATTAAALAVLSTNVK